MPAPTARFEQHATRAAFFIPGFVVACWAPLVPFAKVRLDLEESQLGILLLCLGLGSLVAMPLSGMVAARRGPRLVMISTVLLMLAMLPLLTFVSSPWFLALILIAFGGAIGAMDCVMNIQAVAVERSAGKPMMSGFHAFYSIGSLVGATFVTLLLSAHVGTLAAIASAVVIAAVVAFASQRAWRSDKAAQDGPVFALPRGVVIAIGAVCFITFLAEGAMLDWSAVFLHDVRQIDLGHAGWGFVAFNLAMTVTRLVGDRLVEALGLTRAVLGGGALAAAGLAIATLSASLPIILSGYALVGIGCANIVPVMFSLAGRQTRMPESIAIPAVTTMAYAGVLAGPALIGFVAQGWSLSGAFLIVSGSLLVAGVMGSKLRSA
ncbi:MFS transporter [Lysobacteraceae bacterium NML93-0792]|nr:MFS transporter [Xanthomonadaceae bacterium NML93-0792]PBS16679.1 MFS transporter [Xanthomonadaceae bacterium NML93-0793]PBS20253.1 MFS transporter [Xanthomonadaceae bacterium NML93-0831]